LPRLIRRRLTHGVIGNTSDFGSEESGFEPLWVNKNAAFRGFFVERMEVGRGVRSLSRQVERSETVSGNPCGSTKKKEAVSMLNEAAPLFYDLPFL
jgi:hypothetical protein